MRPMYKVVIVEDSSLLRKGMIHTMDWVSLDCQVVGSAGDGPEGLRVILETQPDIILTDIRMPGMNGLEMIDAAWKQGCAASVIIISAYDDFNYAQQGMKLGAVEYLVKPVEDEDVCRAIRSACARVDARRQLSRLQEKLGAVESSKVQVFQPYLNGEAGIKNEYTCRAIRFVEEHYGEEINVARIAKALSISESHLGKVFKDTMNTTIGEYIIHYRITRACRLLQNPQCRIYEAAARCGYADQRYFSVVFKRIMGMTPNEFRSRSIKKNP